jgi:FkbM family methyltransferase
MRRIFQTLTTKIGRAASLLRNEGCSALLKEMVERVRTLRRPRPDESAMIFRVLSHQQQRGTMIDVGAHVGTALAPFARAGWQVVAFEPDSVNRKRLEESFRSFPNVSIDPRALADEPRKAATLFRSEVSTGISSLSPFHSSHVAAGTIDVTTLETVSRDRSIRSLDFLKIDTEGYDLPVLKGLPWRTLKPRVILCEFEDTKTGPLGYSFRDLGDFLQERGYKLIVSEWYPVKRYGARHQWRRFALYPCQLADPASWGNIIGTDSEPLHHEMLQICRRYGPVEGD